MILYEDPRSGNCYKVRLLLAHLERPYERVTIDVATPLEERPRDFVEYTSTRRVPLLVLPDGEPIPESNAILSYLAEGTAFLPEERLARARTLGWMFFEQNQHEPNLATARYWRSISDEPQRMAHAFPLWESRGADALAAMERHLLDHDFFGGRAPTVADLALYPYTHVAHEGGFDLEPYPAVRRWLERVRSQPGHVPMDA